LEEDVRVNPRKFVDDFAVFSSANSAIFAVKSFGVESARSAFIAADLK
jgi:hypothetical protein